jgi:hypothetical protein
MQAWVEAEEEEELCILVKKWAMYALMFFW